MALTSTTIQPTENITNTPVTPKHTIGGGEITSLLGAIMLSVYAGQKSRKQLRKIKRQMAFLLIKQKLKNAFTKAATDRKTLTLVLIAVLIVALVLIEPLAALVLAIIGLVLLLAGVI